MSSDNTDASTAPSTPSQATSMRGVYEAGREREFLDLLLEHLDLSVSILDSEQRYRLISGGTYKHLNLTPDQLNIGTTLDECHQLMIENGLFKPDVIEASGLSAEKLRTQTDAGSESQPTGARLKRPSNLVQLGNGKTHRFSRKRLPDGAYISIASDVSELVEKDSLLDGALTLGGAAYWTYEFATKRYSMSQGFQAYLGRQAVDLVDKKGILAVVHPEDRERFKTGIRSLSSGNNQFEAECRSLTYKGNERWSRSTVEMIRDPNGRPLRLRAFVKDTTRERRDKAELEAAKDNAVAASHAKSEFLANMSHEIRTPMNGVLGMAELLANSVTDDRQREYVNVINNSATALLNIINDILDFSKIEAGALEIDPMPFDLKSSISDVAAMLVGSAQDKGLELIVNYPVDLPANFIGDAGRLRQVVTNLVSNAIKFTDTGHVEINVDVKTVRDTAVISIEVRDTGIGIAQAKQSTIFDKFTQADGSTTRVYGGTGLGLTISRRIIEMMDGRLSVSSVPGSGSTFCARLPLKIDRNARTEKFDTQTLLGKRVLIVDDIDVNRTLLSRQIESWDMTADVVSNGAEAIIAITNAERRGQPYDLVLLDFLMPNMDGRELATVIRHRLPSPAPAMIMLSSCDQSVSSPELAAIGIESYLVKPVRERRLFDTVVRVLSNPVVAPSEERPAEVDITAQVRAAAAQQRPRQRMASLASISIAPDPKAEDAKSDRQEILIAEDFPLNQDVCRLMLIDTAFEPVFAANGQQAVEMYTAEPSRFPLIVMDISMPVMDGFQATQAIRDWEATTGAPRVPIIALTGHALKDDRQECLDAGMDDYLTKPVKQTGLLEKLERFSGRAVDAAPQQKTA